MKEKVFLIDAMSMIYRSYYAMISRPLVNMEGKNVSAIAGFLNSILKILDEEEPDHFAICFDTEKPTFRHKAYPKYKANRLEIPTDMPWQIDKVKEIVTVMNLPLLEVDGYEADDIVGTLVKQASKEDITSYMVTTDKDYMQLVTEKALLYKPLPGSAQTVEIIDKDGVIKKFGVPPEKVVEVLGLMGDKTDNIPGVPGIGEVTAIQLIKEFGSIDNIYRNIDKIDKPKLKEKLITYKDDAQLSKKLVTIFTEVPLSLNIHQLNIKEYDTDRVVKSLESIGLKALVRKISERQVKLISKKEVLADEEVLIPVSSPLEEVEEPASPIVIKGEKVEPESEHGVKVLKTLKDIPHRYFTAGSKKNFDELVKTLNTQSLVAFDTETDGLDFVNSDIIGMSFCFREGEAYYVPLKGVKKMKQDSISFFEKDTTEPTEGIDLEYAIREVKTILENKEIAKVGQNIKFDYLMMRKYGIEMQNIHFDTMIGAYILNPAGVHNMDYLAEYYLGYKTIHINELIGQGKSQKSMNEISVDRISEYAAEDADVTLQLYYRIKYELIKEKLYTLCENIEFPLIEVLADMEFTGVKIDKAVLKVLDKEITKLMKEAEDKIYHLAGEKFNINSTKQLQEILFDKLKLTVQKKTKKGSRSTDVSVLEDLKFVHPIASELLEYRMLSKLKTTYIDGLINSINPQTGRIHTSFLQTQTATGRLASVNPNLQNIPIRTDIGRAIRKAFVPENNQYVMLSADYSQIELRIMAHYSEDDNFINAFNKGRDIHAETAMRVFDVKSKKDVTAGMRRKAKEVNFGIIYGIGAFGLARRLEIKNTEAKEIIDRYFHEFPKVREYMQRTVQFARENGYVETLMGRRRYLPQINNQNATVRAEDERAAINMPIQGTAADMIKIAMIKIFREFRKRKFKSKMLLQVHDELVFEVDKNELEEVKEIVTTQMKKAISLKVPIEVEVGIGNSWYEAH
ncbi:MAG: DNA polymerase I [Ignavibacteria bacterium]